MDTVFLEPPAMAPLVRPPRDLRLDWFRGLLQIFIFISHVSGNWFVLLIHKSYGFSDSSELFVFLSGYTLASVYTLKARRDGRRAAVRDMLRRAWALYLKHLALFAGMMLLIPALLALVGRAAGGDLFRYPVTEARPLASLAAGLVLWYQPPYLDILPLFVAMMLALPLMMALPVRWGWWALAPSVALWLAVQLTRVNLPDFGYPEGWTFNPLAWQLMFMAGALVGRGALLGQSLVPRGRLVMWAAVALLLFALPVAFLWALGAFWDVPSWDALWPLDKRNLSPWLLAHALAVALVVARLAPATAPAFRQAWAQPLIRCGRYSLDVFCVGVPLSLVGSAALRLAPGWLPQVAVNLAGITLLILFARWRDGRRRAQPEGAAARQSNRGTAGPVMNASRQAP